MCTCVLHAYVHAFIEEHVCICICIVCTYIRMHVCGLTLLCKCLVNADRVFTFSLLYFMMHPAFNKKGKCNATLLLHNVCVPLRLRIMD